MAVSETVQPGDAAHSLHHRQLAIANNALYELTTSGRLSTTALGQLTPASYATQLDAEEAYGNGDVVDGQLLMIG